MSSRQSLDKSTKNYFAIASNLEAELKAVVESLLKDRNELQAKVEVQTARLTDLEHKNIRLTAINQQNANMIGFLQNSTLVAQERFQSSESFAKSAIEIAQRLTDDRESEHGSVMVTPRSQMMVACNNLAEANQQVAAEVLAGEHDADNSNDANENANGGPKNANEDENQKIDD